MYKIFTSILIATLFFSCREKVPEDLSPEKQLFNEAWQFVKAEDVSDTATIYQNEQAKSIAWDTVNLPHTAHIEPLVIEEEQWQGTSYYRKSFPLSDDEEGRHIALKFEAAMQVAEVFINGKKVFKHLGGYLPFYVDISNDVNFGEDNVVVVKLNNEDNPQVPPGKPIADLDFNIFSGIYRNVHLIKKEKIYISDAIAANEVAGGGVLLHYENISNAGAQLHVQTDVQNDHDEGISTEVKITLEDKKGNKVAELSSEAQEVGSGANGRFSTVLDIESPVLWSPENPYLYTLKVALVQDDQIIDQQEVKTGVRHFEFEADGFYLNGEKYFIRGTNRHQEYPYIGYALSDNAQYRDAWKIKEAGFNFVRLSHYPQSQAFLQACNELGLLVMDAIPGWQFFGDAVFQENSLQDVRDMVRSDRNHPSIILWEASLNESSMTEDFMQKAHDAVHEELPYGDVYTCGWVDQVYDVFIPARQHGEAPEYWNNYDTGKPLLVAEYGDWEYYAQNAGFNQSEFADLKEEERTSRQLRGAGEKRLLQQALNYQEAHNSNMRGNEAGDANWLMFDYNRGYAPDLESSGISDIFRLPKFAFHFYKSQLTARSSWASESDENFAKPSLFIASYWNSESAQDVTIFSNCDEVELFLNGKSLGRQEPDDNDFSSELNHPPFTFSLKRFEAGTLKAEGYIKNIKAISAEVHSPKEAAAITLTFDRSGKDLSKNDVVFVYASVVDENGTVLPQFDKEIQFKVQEGAAILVGDNPIKAEAGIATILLKTGMTEGDIVVSATAQGMEVSETIEME